MQYGNSIGVKFYEDGAVRQFPGNTVVADVVPGSEAYMTMCRLRQMVIDAGLDSHLILMPEDSYHITYISGFNDQQRIDGYWPEDSVFSRSATMKEADAFVAAAIEKVGIPGPARMKFDNVGWGAGCCIICLKPADPQEHQRLFDFRDRAAEAMGVHRPNHENYRFHITLGYTRVITEGEAEEKRLLLKQQMEELMAQQPEFLTTQAYMAYFDDMYAFSPNPIR